MENGRRGQRATVRPLWRILLAEQRESLTCEECTAIIGYLADLGAAGVDGQHLLKAARYHLEQCPDCHRHYERHLRDLEEWIDDPSLGETQVS